MGRVSGAFVGETTGALSFTPSELAISRCTVTEHHDLTLAESAGEYHCSDFDWEELRKEVENRQGLSDEAPVQPWEYDPANWEKFHARDNATARFYKERR